jgi:hypothetical protein
MTSDATTTLTVLLALMPRSSTASFEDFAPCPGESKIRT